MNALAEAAITISSTSTEDFRKFYKDVFPIVAAWVRKMNGSHDEASDLFQDAIVIYMEKTSSNDMPIQTSPEAYVLGIVKHLWIRKYKQNQLLASLDLVEKQIALPADENTVNNQRLLTWLEHAGEKCLDLLRMFYFQKMSWQQIIAKTGHRNEHTATVQKFKCVEKLRDTVKQKSLSYEDFLN